MLEIAILWKVCRAENTYSRNNRSELIIVDLRKFEISNHSEGEWQCQQRSEHLNLYFFTTLAKRILHRWKLADSEIIERSIKWKYFTTKIIFLNSFSINRKLRWAKKYEDFNKVNSDTTHRTEQSGVHAIEMVRKSATCRKLMKI